jgi:hypothetical protein
MEVSYCIVYRNPQFFSSFPSIVILNSGEIMVAFREAGEFSVKAAKEDAPSHHDNDSKCCLIFSKDGGNTFGDKLIALDFEYGINDPGLTVLKSGEILLRTTAVQVKPSHLRKELEGTLMAHRPDLGTVSSCMGLTFQRSLDNGKTWTDPVFVEVDGDKDFISRDPAVELEDGALVLPVYKNSAVYAERAYMIRSFDQGQSWCDVSLIAEDARGEKSIFRGINYNEVSVLNLGKGRLLSMIRSDASFREGEKYMAIGGVGELTMAFSDNAGYSWTNPQPTGIFGQPAHLLRLKNGKILCTYGYRKAPYGIRACLSTDDGASWDVSNEILIKEGCLFWDMGYPMSIQREDGSIVTVYYWNDEEKVRYIEAAIWSDTSVL